MCFSVNELRANPVAMVWHCRGVGRFNQRDFLLNAVNMQGKTVQSKQNNRVQIIHDSFSLPDSIPKRDSNLFLMEDQM